MPLLAGECSLILGPPLRSVVPSVVLVGPVPSLLKEESVSVGLCSLAEWWSSDWDPGPSLSPGHVP